MLILHTQSTLTALILLCATLAQAAPTDMSTTTAAATSEALTEGSPTTLEISTLNANDAHSLPNGFSTTDAVYNAQPYATAEVETEAQLAPTSLPMTSEELALAEVAAVVAELATTTADEMKAKTTLAVEKEQRRQTVVEENLVRSRSEEALRQTIEREINNVIETVEGAPLSENADKDQLMATTYGSTFSDAYAITAAPMVSAYKAQTPIAAATTTTTTTPAAPATITALTTSVEPAQTTIASPAILNELVRAAAAANEILAAALNVATKAVADITANNSAATTMKPVETIGSNDGAIGYATTLSEVSDGDALTEASAVRQVNEAEATISPQDIKTKTIATKIVNGDTMTDTTADAMTLEKTTADAIDSETTKASSIHNENNGNIYLTNPLVTDDKSSAYTKEELFKENSTTLAYESSTVIPNSLGIFEAQSKTQTDSSVADKEKNSNDIIIPDDLTHESDNEAAESMQIITKETTTTETTPASSDNEVEPTSIKLDETKGVEASKETNTVLPTNDAERKSIHKGEPQIAANIFFILTTTTESSTNERLAHEYENGSNEIDTERGVEHKFDARQESGREVKKERVNTTMKEDNEEAEDLPITTTESLETLIAVESEARVPNKLVTLEGNENLEFAAFTTEMPELVTSTEALATLQEQTSELNTTTKEVQETTLVGEIMSESTTKSAASDENVPEHFDTNTGVLLKSKEELEITAGGGDKVADNTAKNIKVEVERRALTVPRANTTAKEAPYAEATTMETTIDSITGSKESSEEETTEIPRIFNAESSITEKPVEGLRADAEGGLENKAHNYKSEPITTTMGAVAIKNDESTTQSLQESKTTTTTTSTPAPITQASTPASETIAAQIEDEVLKFTDSLVNVPLVPFTTTTPKMPEEFLQTTKATTNNDFETVTGSEATTVERIIKFSLEATTETTLTEITTTSEQANTELPTKETQESDSRISAEAAAATEAESSVITTTTTEKPDPLIAKTTLEDEAHEQPLYTRSFGGEPQNQQTMSGNEFNRAVDSGSIETQANTTTKSTEISATVGEEESEKVTTPEAEAKQQQFNSSESNEQQRAVQSATSTVKIEAAAIVDGAESITITTTTELAASTEDTEATGAIEITTNAPSTTTTTTSEPATTTTTPTPETTTTTTTSTTSTPAPETTTTTTTSTTTTPAPETTTPTTTTTTTTTTTLSPMSLIIAEHEARSLDKSPPRVSRVVSDDGVEVWGGYSIVNHMHMAALAAMEADGA